MYKRQSLDTPIGEEEDSQLGDFIEDESLLSPVDSASFSMLKEELEEAMASLTERERNVIKLRFGLDDGKTRTLEEVGKEFNVTRAVSYTHLLWKNRNRQFYTDIFFFIL